MTEEEKKPRAEELKDLILEARILTLRRVPQGPRYLWETLDLFRWEMDLLDNVKEEDIRKLTEALDKLADVSPDSEEFSRGLIDISNSIFPELWKKYRGFKNERKQ